MKKTLSLFTTLILCAALAACGAKPTDASVELHDDFLSQLNGTYEELFPVLTTADYDDYWIEEAAKFVGEENAAIYVPPLKTACTGTLYGAAAVEAYGNPETAQFDCYFINGIDRLTVDGSTISGTLDGKNVFSHTYIYQEDNSISGMTDVRVYKTDDSGAGEFTYFLFCEDTPDTTYHIEFRYGSNLEALLQITEGSYAYWLAAGIPVDSGEDFVKSCISLFVEENLSAVGDIGNETGYDLKNISDPFLGKWRSEIPSANTTLILDYKYGRICGSQRCYGNVAGL
jgi:hypothetical protein